MNAPIIAAERIKEVRDAARAWRRAGFLGEDVLSRILALYPDDRRRFGPGFRALSFIFTTIAAWAMIGLWFVLFDRQVDHGWDFFAAALVFTALTEFQRGSLKRADAGAESATALIAVLLIVIGGAIGFGEKRFSDFLLRFLISAFVACALAAWRWGDKLFFLGAGLAGFGLLAQLDQGRLLWIVAGVLLIPACLAGARSAGLGPSYRWGAVILGAVAILALYGAVHIWSFDQRWIESMRETSSSAPETPAGILRTLSILATGLLPPGLLVIGWRRREPLLLYAGLLLLGASLATIRLYRSVMPLSIALILIGAACLAVALGVRRWLRGNEGGECYGFTADPLFDNTNRTEAIRSVVAMASFAPAAAPAPSRPGFEGGGGGFGGGGATGSYS